MESSADEISKDVTQRLLTCGLDLVQVFDIARYNDLIADHETLAPLPLFGRRGALALLVGNTKALWPVFTQVYHTDADLQICADPLDAWVGHVLKACLKHIPAESVLRFSHDPGEGLVSMLHLAQASGLAHVGPAHLAVHPEHGTWIGLRGVIVIDAEPPVLPSGSVTRPCDGCDAPCVLALETALAKTSASEIASSWPIWVAVRDACPVGKASRYSEAQICYHYTKDRAVLHPEPSNV